MSSRPILLTLLLGVSAAAAAAARAQTMPPPLAGTWKITRILPTKSAACWDAERARTLLGTTLRYAPGKLVWHGGEVPVAEALVRRLTTAQFYTEYKLDLAGLGIRASSVQEIDLQHEDADITGATTEVPGDTVLLAGPGRIVVSACGVYYSATRAGR